MLREEGGVVVLNRGVRRLIMSMDSMEVRREPWGYLREEHSNHREELVKRD